MRCLNLPLCVLFVTLAICGEIAFSIPQNYDRFGQWKETDYELMAVPSYTNSQRVLPPPGFTNSNRRLRRDIGPPHPQVLPAVPTFQKLFHDWNDVDSTEVRNQVDTAWPWQLSV